LFSSLPSSFWPRHPAAGAIFFIKEQCNLCKVLLAIIIFVNLEVLVIKAHKIRLNPTPEQEHYFWQCAGVARFAWNWALDKYNQRKAEGQTVKIISKGDCLKSEFARLKKTDYPWLGDVQSYAYQQAFLDLKKAISRYFELKKTGKLIPPLEWKPRKDGKPFGWPRFKSRTKSNPSFYLANNGGIAVEGHWAKIQKCPGLVNTLQQYINLLLLLQV